MRRPVTRVTRAVCAGLLLAAAAATAPAQDAPAGTEAPPPVAVVLPEPPEGSPEAAPRTLVPIGRFLVALPAVPPPLRADGDRLWRNVSGVETPAGLRLGPQGAQELDPEVAKRLLALDVDARRADAGAWLAAIDPSRCSVRVRVPRGTDVPALPDGLQLLEVIVTPGEARAGAAASPTLAALPALPDVRRLAVYGFDVPVDAAAKFREAHPAAALVTSWRESLLERASRADRVRVRIEGTPARAADVAKDAAAARTLVEELQFDETTSGTASPPDAGVTIELLRGERVVTRLGFHDGDLLTWLDGPWPGDARLTDAAAAALTARLADAGMQRATAQLGFDRAARARRIRRDARQQALLGDAWRELHDAPRPSLAAPPLAPAEALRDVALTLRLLGAAGGERDDPVTIAVERALDVAAPAKALAAADAAPDDAELQRGFALWLWELPNRDFLTEEERPILERTARLLAGDEDPGVRVVAVTALKELQLAALLRDVLKRGDAAAPLASQIQAAFALAELGDPAGLKDVQDLLATVEEPLARASLEGALRKAPNDGRDPPAEK